MIQDGYVTQSFTSPKGCDVHAKMESITGGRRSDDSAVKGKDVGRF